MKLVVKREELTAALSAAAAVVPLRSARPSLRNALLVGHGDGHLEIHATDLDVGLRFRLQAESVEEPAALCLPCIPLAGLLREYSEEAIKLETDGPKGLLAIGRDEFEVLGQEASDFPEVPDLTDDDAAHALKISAGDLKRMLDRTIFAAAKEQGRYAINGIFLAYADKALEVVATDGRRMALAKRKLKGKVSWNAEGLIVPVKMMQEIRRLCDTCEETELLELVERDRMMLARGKNETLSCQIIEGVYPKYKQVVPTDNDKEVVFNREALLHALRKAAFLTSDETRVVELCFTPGTCEIEGRSTDKGTAHVTLEVEYDGPKTTIGFNPQYLQECLKALEAEKIRMEMKEVSRPLVVREGKDYLYVQMPVNPASAGDDV